MGVCEWCDGEIPGQRKSRRTCSDRCRKALSRARLRTRLSNLTRARNVTDDNMPYVEPPAGNSIAQDRADAVFRRQLAAEGVRAEPLSDRQRELIALQKRNIGVLLPELQQLLLDRERERQAAEAAERARHQPLAVEDPHQPSTLGSVSRRARYDRARNRPQDPHVAILRPMPGQSGRGPWDDDNQCITVPGRNIVPWRMP